MLLLASLTEHLRKEELKTALRTLSFICLGFYSQYWLFMNVSGFKNPSSALACMLLTRSLLAHPYLHVNIFQVSPRSGVQPVRRDTYYTVLTAGSIQCLGRGRSPKETSPNPCPSPVTMGYHRVYVRSLPGPARPPCFLLQFIPYSSFGSNLCLLFDCFIQIVHTSTFSTRHHPGSRVLGGERVPHLNRDK